MVIGDAIEFLIARGHNVGGLTDYEIEDNFEKAFKNWQHELVERAFYNGLTAVEEPRKWKEYVDRIHQAIERKPNGDSANALREAFKGITQIPMLG